MSKDISCIPTNICNQRCWQFAISVLISFVALVVSIVGLTGSFRYGNELFYQNLLIFVTGVWFPSPRLPDPAKNKEKADDIAL
jgi:hypothetical protein